MDENKIVKMLQNEVNKDKIHNITCLMLLKM